MSGALDALAVKAKELIDKYGKDLSYQDIGDLVYDPSTGSITEPTETATSFVGVVSSYDQKFIDGETIKKGDHMIMAGANGISFTFEEGRQIVIGTERFTIVGIESVYSGNDVAYYTLQVRK